MPSNLADLRSPEPVTIHVAGIDLAIAPLMMNQAAELQAVLDALPAPDPWKTIRLLDEFKAQEAIDPTDYKFQRAEAIAERLAWPPDLLVDDRGLQALTRHRDGQLAILKAAVGVTDDEARALAGALTIMEFMRLASTFLNGKDPEAKDAEADADPKGGSIPTRSANSDATSASPTTTAS